MNEMELKTLGSIYRDCYNYSRSMTSYERDFLLALNRKLTEKFNKDNKNQSIENTLKMVRLLLSHL